MTETAHPAASPFLMSSDAVCPPQLLSLATGAPARPIAFVRAVGGPILETARDAHAAGLAIPVLVGEAGQIEADAAAIGWSLEAPGSSMRTGNSKPSRPRLPRSVPDRHMA